MTYGMYTLHPDGLRLLKERDSTSRMARLEPPIAEVGPSRAARLRRHRPHLDATTKVAEGDPKDVSPRKPSFSEGA
jgi:hypothetical protein